MVREEKIKEAFKKVKRDIEELNKKITMVAELLQEKHDIEFKSLQAEIALLKQEIQELKGKKKSTRKKSSKKKKE